LEEGAQGEGGLYMGGGRREYKKEEGFFFLKGKGKLTEREGRVGCLWKREI